MEASGGWLGISGWDWFTLSLYLVGITVIGVWSVRRIKDTTDFFMGGRSFNRWFMMFFAFGAGTSGNDAVGVASKTYTSGMSGIWYQWLWLFATPFYWLIAPIFRRMRAITTGDYFEQRYDSGVAGLYTVVGVLQLTFNMGILLLGGSKMIKALSGGAIPYEYAIWAMTILFLIYGMAGGLAAAIVTDLVQGILTIILSFMILPSALNAVGGMTGLREKIGDPAMFSLVSPGEINGFHILMAGLIALIGIVTQPHIMGVCAAGKTEMDGRFGFATGNLIKRFCTVAWMLVGLAGIAMYPDLAGTSEETSPDLVYGLAARDLLPAIMPGLIGVFLAALLASIMSSCDAFMISSSGLFTENFWRRFIVRNGTEHHYVWVGRITALCIVMAALWIAFQLESVPTGLEWFFKIQGIMGAAFWLGLFWRRTTVAGAWAGTIAGFLVMVLTSAQFAQPWYVENLPDNMLWAGTMRFSYSVFFYLTTSFVVAIVVSLFTQRVPEPKLRRLYDCLRTPVTGPEPHLRPFTLPPGVVPATPRKLINHPDLEIYMPTAVGMIGFAIFWGWVAALIAFVYWLSSIGA